MIWSDLKDVPISEEKWYAVALSRTSWNIYMSQLEESTRQWRIRRSQQQHHVFCATCERNCRRERNRARHKCIEECQSNEVLCSVPYVCVGSGAEGVHTAVEMHPTQTPNQSPTSSLVRRSTRTTGVTTQHHQQIALLQCQRWFSMT